MFNLFGPYKFYVLFSISITVFSLIVITLVFLRAHKKIYNSLKRKIYAENN